MSMIYADSPSARGLAVYQNGKMVQGLTAFNPDTGEAIQFITLPIFGDHCLYFGNYYFYVKLVLNHNYRYIDSIPTRHYFMRDFEIALH